MANFVGADGGIIHASDAGTGPWTSEGRTAGRFKSEEACKPVAYRVSWAFVSWWSPPPDVESAQCASQVNDAPGTPPDPP